MKILKKLWVLVIVLLIGFIANSCKEDDEEPKDQSTVITGLFDNNASATVKGHMTDTEWNGVAEKIKIVLNGAFDDTTTGMTGIRRTALKNVFGDDVVIVVEKNPNYIKYKVVDGMFRTLYVNFVALDGLQSDIITAVTAMLNETPIVE